MQTIYLDISNKGVIPTIHAKQGDVGRKFQVVLTDSGLPYIPVGGSAFSVWYSGASGEGNYTEVGDKSAFSVSGNKVTVEMISQMLSNDGEGILSLVLNDPNGNQISTWNIHYICEYVPGAGSQEAKAYYTAFSQAVENLPYPDASLSASGKAADAAAVGTALAGKAPAGYGLGDKAVTAPNNDANQITKCGFFRAYVNTPTGDWWTIQQEDLYGNGTHMIQKASCFAYTFVLHAERMVVDGKFYEWEWENPPMELGKEYRTTERWEGKAVFTKLVDCGFMPNSAVKNIEIGVAASAIIDYRLMITSDDGALTSIAPYQNTNLENNLRCVPFNAGINILTNADLSNFSGSCVVKYYKA